jgi:hypothetical protein
MLVMALTSCMPSMCGRFTPPCKISRDHTTAQVKGVVEGRVVGRREVALSAVSGKSLAETLRGRSGMNAGAVVPAQTTTAPRCSPLLFLLSDDYGSSVVRTATLIRLWEEVDRGSHRFGTVPLASPPTPVFGTVPLCVIYEGWVIVKPWSAPGWWQVVVAADQGGGRVDQSPIRAGRPWCRAAGAAQSSWRPLHSKAMTHTERAFGRPPARTSGRGRHGNHPRRAGRSSTG